MEHAPREAEFNSGIAYLKRLDSIIKVYHMSYSDNDADSVFRAVDSLYCELDPRMEKHELQLHYKLRINAKNSLRKNDLEPLREWFLHLNRFAHSQKLIMRDADTMPGVIRG